MLTFLSDDWIAALDAAGSVGDRGSETPYPADPVLTIQQQVRDATRGDVVYAVLVYDDEIRVRKGAAPTADVTFVVDRDTAAAIAQGRISAQAAFMSGDLRLIGEAAALLRSQAALTDLADRFATVRTRTRW